MPKEARKDDAVFSTEQLIAASLREKPEQPVSGANWRALKLLNVYRFSLCILIGLISIIDGGGTMLGSAHMELFFIATTLYFLFTGFNQLALQSEAFSFHQLLHLNIFIDLLFIAVLMFSSGGVATGLGSLLAVSIAAAAFLGNGKLALFVAVLASGLLLGDYVLVEISSPQLASQQLGWLFMNGVMYFAIVALANVQNRKAEEARAIAERRVSDLANLTQLNEYIIQRMESGVLVVDNSNEIRLINQAAWYLLGMPVKGHGRKLEEFSAELTRQFRRWLRDDDFEPESFHVAGLIDVFPRFSQLGSGKQTFTLIILEDNEHIDRQAQHVKLAALGRLTASIAHEIRNPLGAISHAGQLLAESKHLDQADVRLTQIIREQSARMNNIIENIMQLGRRDKAQPEEFDLLTWIRSFIDEYMHTHPKLNAEIRVSIDPKDTFVRMDPGHLHQVLNNLCENALKYGVSSNGQHRMELRGGISLETRAPYLEIIDFGPGIEAAMAQQIFEPFFTTDSKGTGLGLYIARELCEANQARLQYIATPAGGSCFRIQFVMSKKRVTATEHKKESFMEAVS